MTYRASERKCLRDPATGNPTWWILDGKYIRSLTCESRSVTARVSKDARSTESVPGPRGRGDGRGRTADGHQAERRSPAGGQPAPESRNPAMTLWYDEPATDWESKSLPIGNGALGMSVFGGVQNEQLQFNEKSLWTGGPGSPDYDFGNWRTPRPTAISDVQNRITAEGQVTPEWAAGVLGQPRPVSARTRPSVTCGCPSRRTRRRSRTTGAASTSRRRSRRQLRLGRRHVQPGVLRLRRGRRDRRAADRRARPGRSASPRRSPRRTTGRGTSPRGTGGSRSAAT